MIATDAAFSSFSYADFNPSERRALHAKLIIDAARTNTIDLLRRFGQQISDASSGLVDVLSDWCGSAGTIEEAMQLPLLLRMIGVTEIDPVWVAAQVASHLHAQGRDGDWSASLAWPASLAFGWRSTPCSREFRVSARGGRIEVSLDGAAPIAASALPQKPQMFRLGNFEVPILGSQTQEAFPVDGRVGFADIPADDLEATLAQVVSIFFCCAPPYLDWVGEAVSALVPIARPDAAHYQSLSLVSLPGVVFVSFPAPPLKIAELLVHESSHQYFHFAQFGTSLTNGKDKRLYRSPYVNRDRPIDRILIAFHAFANVVLFYRACLTMGISECRDLVRDEIETNLDRLRPMSDDLERSPGLSPAGRCMFEAIRKELFR